MKRLSIVLAVLIMVSQYSYAETSKKKRTDANVTGHVVSNGEHIPFATIQIKGTTIGTTTDETGHYNLVNLPVGEYIFIAQSLGYKPLEITVKLESKKTKEVHFNLIEDVLGLEEVVVTGNRSETNRKESSTIVNTINSKIFARTQSVTLSEGLNFSPGLRMENNCQNCGFTQVRMNGMEGPYSQILINSRPIFSGLAGVYGLELIPSNMIEKVEVIRGGGSALYGSNAIAGTINLILKDPINDSYEFGINTGLIGVGQNGSGGVAEDYTVNFNASVVSSDYKTGMAVYGFYRDREPFDANDDTFSEISSLKNTTVGTRVFHRFNAKSKIALDFFNIKEDRRGGDKHESLNHEANISEAVEHDITTGAISYDQFINSTSKLNIFASGQRVHRDSYYGANQSLKDYGFTKDFSYTVGAQYNATLGNSKIVAGIENIGQNLTDTKLGYPDFENIVNGIVPHTEDVMVADQRMNTFGMFVQYEHQWDKFNMSVGARFDKYNVEDIARPEHGKKTGNVFSPRITLKYDLSDHLQFRTSYSQGYRAPQIFDEDLHIETSGSRKVLHENDPNLKQETSHSYMASMDFNDKIGNTYVGLLIEGFYTKLVDPFAPEYSDPDANGTVIYTRVNAEGKAIVKGVNLELNIVPSEQISFVGGYTIQSSKYDEPQEFNEQSFLRTPNNYGYFTLSYEPIKKFVISSTANYTGSMLVPYFGLSLADPEVGELRSSKKFFDFGLKLQYSIKLNGASLQFYTGVKNIFNSYQNDFDHGIDRDPGYIYGPLQPRTINFGIKVGNML
ncbi:MAG: TonB-dependent receptor [Bacteroidetes bacterium]|nr:TonB-dependent receptor [Bacteroidota bacterium]